jgi:hypothetical protein
MPIWSNADILIERAASGDRGGRRSRPTSMSSANQLRDAGVGALEVVLHKLVIVESAFMLVSLRTDISGRWAAEMAWGSSPL